MTIPIGEVKLRVSATHVMRANIERENNRLIIRFGFNVALKDEIKAMESPRWHGFDEDNPRKVWSIADSPRNHFQLAYLMGLNPYAPYDEPLIDYKSDRPLYNHQNETIAFELTRRHCIIAEEMGLGKSISAIEAMEYANGVLGFKGDSIWLGPKSALESVKYEFIKWRAKVIPLMYTYEAMKGFVEKGLEVPQILICDEASRLKNPTAQRTQAVKFIADTMRKKYGKECLIILMTGTPAPKDPADWWSLAEIVCPGFLKEGNVVKFKHRLALIEQYEGIGGASFPKLVTWWDNPNKCAKCGKLEDDPDHDSINMTESWYHPFKASVNEVQLLYERLRGLVLVKFKKDCFAGDTEIMTKSGVYPIKELAEHGHADLYVQTPNGMEWVDCQIKSFGIQETVPIIFGDGNEVRATLGHRWLVRNDCRAINNRGPFQTKRTDEIKVGKDQLPLASFVLPELNYEGYAHGFVYGDGHVAKSQATGRETTRVVLYGNDVDLYDLLCQFGKPGMMKRFGWQSYVDTINNMPEYWTLLPKNPTKSYAAAFIFGLISADGSHSKTNFVIQQANRNELIKIRQLALWCGFRCNHIRLAREYSPFDGSYKPLWAFTIQTYNLNCEHFLREDHKVALRKRKRFTSTTITKIGWNNKREEEVFCAIVPEYHNFTLANNVITRNCIDLPSKIFKVIKVKPSSSVLRASNLIRKTASSAAKAMILNRELSDGFQYQEVQEGEETCPLCNGRLLIKVNVDVDDPMNPLDGESLARGHRALYDENGLLTGFKEQKLNIAEREIDCIQCNGSGKVPKYIRTAIRVDCPKDEVIINLLDEYDEIGRFVLWGAFTESVDRCVETCLNQKWSVIRIDGRGWWCSLPELKSPVEMLQAFDNKDAFPKLVVVGNPGAGGMGLNLTASPVNVFYSNSFKLEDRLQAIDRIHRPGADFNIGCLIIDIVHLPQDELVLQSHDRKANLMMMSMGQLNQALSRIEENYERVI